MSLPARTDVVIIGGGIIGCSIAYHLAKLGITDVLLLERRQLTCGTTWHAAGLVPQLRATRTLTELAKYTSELLKTLEAETGQATGFKHNGAIGVALGAAATWATERFAGWQVSMTPASILLAVGFSVFVGVFFGFYPARRASRLLPIQALRYE